MPPPAPRPAAAMEERVAEPTMKVEVKGAWSDVPETSQYTGWTNLKIGFWILIAVALAGAAIGLSIVMVHQHNNRGPPSPPAPPRPPSPPSPATPPPNPPGVVNSPPPPAPGAPSDSGAPDSPNGGGSVPTPSGTPPFSAPTGWTPVWWDEFDGSSLNMDYWSYDVGNGDWGWGNNEQEYYTDSGNLAVSNGVLSITAKRESVNGQDFTSARINSQGKVNVYPGMTTTRGQTYDSVYIETSIQAPNPGQGLWPAFWMYPTNNVYGAWAASGEIDVMEMINAMTRANTGLHYGGSSPQDVKNVGITQSPAGTTYADGFHVYGVIWEATQISFFIDGSFIKTLKSRSVDPSGWYSAASNATPNAPFDIPFYFIINLAVGGLWPKPADDTTPFPATLNVEYVRVMGSNS